MRRCAQRWRSSVSRWVVSVGDGWRYERKYLLEPTEGIVLASILSAVMATDGHAHPLLPVGGHIRLRPACGYNVRSLYFDDDVGSGLRDKLDGVDGRFRYRIRIYDGHDDVIRLEKKSRRGDRVHKDTARLTRRQTLRILGGDLEGWLESPSSGIPSALCLEAYAAARVGALRPAVVVDYLREPFVYPIGSVRITLDTRIRCFLPPRAGSTEEFFDPASTGLPVLEEEETVLEVKSDGPLPAFLRELLPDAGPLPTSFSKYALCRVGSPNGPDVAL